MSSKINGIESRSTGPAGSARAVERVRDVVSQPRTAEQESGEVQITGTARQLIELEQMVKDMPAVDEARVAAISAALEQGTYTVSSQKVADSLLQIEKALAPLTGKR